MAYFGKYRAVVKDTNDPEKRGRIKVECPEVLGKQLSAWALPCFPPNQFSIPKKDTLVWVEFEGGRIDSPIWVGVFYTKEQWKAKFVVDYSVKDFIMSPQLTVKIQGDITADKKLNVTGITEFKNTVTVDGITTLKAKLNGTEIATTGNITAGGSISASGNISASGSVTGSNIP